MEGWFKFYRKIMDWEWVSSPNHLSVFIYLLTNANHTPRKWKGIQIKKGQLITGRKKISEFMGVKEHTVQRVLQDLKRTGHIDIQATTKFSIITITNWKKLQDSEQEKLNKNSTKTQQLNTNKNVKNDNNVKNENNSMYLSTPPKGGDLNISKNIVFKDGKLKFKKEFKDNLTDNYNFLPLDGFITSIETQLSRRKEPIRDLEPYFLKIIENKAQKVCTAAFITLSKKQ